MKKLIFLVLFSYFHAEVSSMRVVVSGYNSVLRLYNVEDNQIYDSADWYVGDEGKDMTWLQLDGDTIWAGHEVGEYNGESGNIFFERRREHFRTLKSFR